MKVTTRKLEDDWVNKTIKIKDQLDDLGERCKKSACAEQFLDNVSDPNYAEDSLALERTGSDLGACFAHIRKV